jgi:hypothetical protein
MKCICRSDAKNVLSTRIAQYGPCGESGPILLDHTRHGKALDSAKHPEPVQRCNGALLGLELARSNDLDLGFGLVTRGSLAVLNFPEEKDT